MINRPTLEEIEEFGMPSIKKLSSQTYNHRKVYLHFFNDEDDYFPGGYDPDSERFVCYHISSSDAFIPYGGWDVRKNSLSLDELASKTSATGAELVRNLNFKPCKANEVPKIQACNERNKKDTEAARYYKKTKEHIKIERDRRESEIAKRQREYDLSKENKSILTPLRKFFTFWK